MSVTLDDVKLARKRAYDRVDYWLQKYRGMTIHEAGISIPRIPKDLHPSEYGEWFDYFESFTGAQEEGGTEDYLEGENEPPELNPEYHNEPEPIEPDLPEEPEPPEPIEPDLPEEPEPPEPAEDEETAPDYVEYEDLVKQRSFDISPEAGDSVSEALDNIRQQFENIDDMDSYEQGLKDIKNDNYLWNNLQRALRYLESGKEGEAHAEINRALSKVYKHFGMTYYREY